MRKHKKLPKELLCRRCGHEKKDHYTYPTAKATPCKIEGCFCCNFVAWYEQLMDCGE